MRYIEYRENRQHGTRDFPFAFYNVMPTHPRYNMTWHWHNEYELIYVYEGEFRLNVNDYDEYTLRPGDSALISSGVLHGGCPSGCHYVCVVFDLESFLQKQFWAADIYRSLSSYHLHIQTYFPAELSEIHSLVENIFSALSEEYEGCRFTVIGSLYQLLGIIFQNGFYSHSPISDVSKTKKITQFKSVLSYITEHYTEDLSLQAMAACAGMNSNYFCKIFKEMTHRSPIEYLNYYRIESACEQLAYTNKSVTEVALDCGFSDTSYFVKVFKRFKGLTPSCYAKQYNTTESKFLEDTKKMT